MLCYFMLCYNNKWESFGRNFLFYFIQEPRLELEKAITDTNVILGENLILTCEASGEPEPRLTWYRNGLPINATLKKFSLTENTLTIPIMTTKTGGSYKCIYDNGVLTASSSAMVEIIGNCTCDALTCRSNLRPLVQSLKYHSVQVEQTRYNSAQGWVFKAFWSSLGFVPSSAELQSS